MIRVLVINAFLFVLPFALTWIWVRFIAAKQPDAQTRKYYAVAAVAGLVLVVASVVSYRAGAGHATGDTYVPPSYQGGQIVPGRFE